MKRYLQKIGSSILLPIAVIPAASILMGIGYLLDPSGLAGTSGNPIAIFLIQAGMALITKLPILFAVGIAAGMSRDKSGAAALSGMVSFLVVSYVLSPACVGLLKGIPAEQVNPAFSNIENTFIGIICGIISAELYNRFHQTKLPVGLAFFSGKRLVPILCAGSMLIVSLVLLFVWPLAYDGLISLGTAISALGPVGAGLYGFGNKMLLPIGLHHALNAVFMQNVAGINDMVNFWTSTGVKGVTGMYMAGFFPIMMFGLPAAALAIYRCARPERKKEVASLMIAGAVASFFTGITEPIEFAFLFAAPPLFLVHAVLTGLSVAIAASMHWIAGFSFSSGLIDFLLSYNMPLANKPYMLLVLGVVFGIIYYLVFMFMIRFFDLKTPGREDVDSEMPRLACQTAPSHSGYAEKAAALVGGLGGRQNILSMEHCATRLRLQVADGALVDEKMIKAAGSLGLVHINKQNLQIIIGPDVQFVYDEIQGMIQSGREAAETT